MARRTIGWATGARSHIERRGNGPFDPSRTDVEDASAASGMVTVRRAAGARRSTARALVDADVNVRNRLGASVYRFYRRCTVPADILHAIRVGMALELGARE